MSESNKKTAVIGQKTESALRRLEYIEQLAKSLLARVELERSGIDPGDDQVIGTVDIDLHALEIFLAAARNFDTDPTKRLLAWLRESYPGCDATDTSQIPAWILPALKRQFVEDADYDDTMLRDGLMRAVNYKAREFYHYRVSTDPEEMGMRSWSSVDLTDPSESEDILLRIPIDTSIHQAVQSVERLLDWMKEHDSAGHPRFTDIPPF